MENTSDSFMPRPLLFCLKSGRSVCYSVPDNNKVKRNPDGDRRSEFNADKTKLLRVSLFEYFRNEPNISFCYYADPAMENDDATILRNFSK